MWVPRQPFTGKIRFHHCPVVGYFESDDRPADLTKDRHLAKSVPTFKKVLYATNESTRCHISFGQYEIFPLRKPLDHVLKAMKSAHRTHTHFKRAKSNRA